MSPLCTAGYEGRTADDFVQMLTAHRIEVVVDVRERPFSRKHGFSKTALAERLANEGVEYIHVRELGNPKHYRDALRNGWAFEEFVDAYELVLESRAEALAAVREVAAEKKACLLCFEADPARCHRSLVAQALADWVDSDLEVIHLGHAC